MDSKKSVLSECLLCSNMAIMYHMIYRKTVYDMTLKLTPPLNEGY